MRGRFKSGLIVGLLAVVSLLALTFFDLSNPRSLLSNDSIASDDLDRIPANRWLRYHQARSLDWRRQGHAGIAFDEQRGTFYVFGSDTHNENWDNSVHEFDPVSKSWSTHYPPADPGTYRVDERGVGVSGDGDAIFPWAMHTFDNVVYDPINDTLVVNSTTDHNPASKTLGQSPKIQPTWFYYLPLRIWLLPENLEQKFPRNFAGSSAYDTRRQAVVSYGSGLAELGPDRDVWQKVAVEKHHGIHHTMEYDSVRGQLVVFGDYRNTNSVWVYTPGPAAGEAGAWAERKPGGDYCPPDQHFPVALDKHNGVFLIVPDEKPAKAADRADTAGSVAVSSTLIYDPVRNEYRKLPDADLPAQRMNYMMVYDTRRRVFFLVTGDWKSPPVVWVLRLDVSSLHHP